MRTAISRRSRRFVRRITGNKILSALFFVVATLFLATSFVLASVTFNVYLHELAHYTVADHYELDPSIQISNVVEFDESSRIVFNANPTAHTIFQDPHDDKVNFEVTFSGPLMNVLITLAFSLVYVVIRVLLYSGQRQLKLAKNYERLWKMMKLTFFVDVLFISIIVPSLISVFVNFSNIPGSDGSILREILSK